MTDLAEPTVAPVAAPAAADPDWWRGAVIYQIYPRSFQDSNGDGIGDLKGITRRLGYVADLGVDAIWLSPFFTSPQRDFGYDISDYCGVDPMFGTLEDFDHLVKEAHRLGLKVMIDQVLSHSSDQHPWFVESRSSRTNPKADWYVWADMAKDGSPPNNWQSVFGGSSWQWDSRRRQYYLHNFLANQPDINLHHPDAQNAILNSVKFWLDRGVDGFRLDTTNFYFHDLELRSNPPAEFVEASKVFETYHYQEHVYDKNRPETIGFLQRLRGLLDRYPGTATVGEIGYGPRSLDLLAQYTSGDDKLHMAYTFDFLGHEFSAAFFRQRIARFEAGAKESWPCWAFSNHDVVRHLSRWRGHADDPLRLAKLAASLLLSLRGSICLYQGEELALGESELAFEDLVDPYGIRLWPEFKGRDGCRTPMVWEAADRLGGFTTGKPWLPVTAEHLDRAADRQVDDPNSVLQHYRRTLSLRHRHPALRRGTIDLLPDAGQVLAFIRRGGGEAVLCIFNLGRTATRYALPEIGAVTALDGFGWSGRLGEGGVELEATDAFFGQLA
jgi:alpha-glucosidase